MMQQNAPWTLDEALSIIDSLSVGPVDGEEWRTATIILRHFDDPDAQNTIANKIAEKWGVEEEEVWAYVKAVSVHPKDRIAAAIEDLPAQPSEDDVRNICRDIAAYIVDEVTQKILTNALARKTKKLGLSSRDLTKLVRQYQHELNAPILEALQQSQAGNDPNDNEQIILQHGGLIKEALPDAPIPEGLRLPKDYVLRANGKIERVEPRWLVPVSIIPMFIVRRIEHHDTEGDQHYRELVYRVNGRWSSVVVPSGMLADGRKILKLADMGVPVADHVGKALARYFYEFEQRNVEHLPTTTRISRMGWREWNGKTVFVWGPYTLGIPKDEAPEVAVDSPGEQQLLDALQPGGTWEGWLDEVMAPAMQYPSFRMGIYAALASPLLAHCAVQGFVFHYARRSTRGKTTAAQVAISTAGYPGGPGVPDKPGLCRPWNATRVGPERVFSFLRHIPAYLDDSQEIRNDDDLAKIIYMLANGSGRLRGSLKGIQNTALWRLVAISTGENTLSDASKMAGVLVRAIDWTIEPFEGAQPGTDLAAEALRFKVAASKHYGQALPRFVLSLIKYGVERLASEHLELTARIAQRVRERLEQPNELVDRIAGAFGVIALAAALFHELTIPKDHPLAKVTREEVEEFVTHWFARLMEERNPEHTHVQAYHAVQSWVLSNLESFYNDSKRDEDQPPGGWLGVYPQRVEGISGELVAIFIPQLQDFMRKYGYPYDAVIREWREEGWLIPDSDKKHLARQIWFRGKKTRAIVIRLTTFGEGDAGSSMAEDPF